MYNGRNAAVHSPAHGGIAGGRVRFQSLLLLVNTFLFLAHGIFYLGSYHRSLPQAPCQSQPRPDGAGRAQILPPGDEADSVQVLRQREDLHLAQLKELRETLRSALEGERLCRQQYSAVLKGAGPVEAVGSSLRTAGGKKEVGEPPARLPIISPAPSPVDKGGSTNAIPWLIIGIPTVPRRKEVRSDPNTGQSKLLVSLKDTMLFRTLSSMVKQIEGTLFEGVLSPSQKGSGFTAGGVHIVVKNSLPKTRDELKEESVTAGSFGNHIVFDECRKYFSGQSTKDALHRPPVKFISFIDYGATPLSAEQQEDQHAAGNGLSTSAYYRDTPVPFAPEFADSDKERPTPRVRRQTLDVISLLDHVVNQSHYFYFTEDDFEFCPNTLLALSYMVSKANSYQGVGKWAGIRCSFGLNGILMHNGGGLGTDASGTAKPPDVWRFGQYLLRHFNRRPPDHLVVEFYAKESEEAKEYFGDSRHVMAFRYNVGNHIGGQQSTLREEEAWSFPGCFTELIAPQVFPVEAWNPVDCPEDDLWPCNYPNAAPTYISWNTSLAAQVSKVRDVYLSNGKKIKRKGGR
jgi:hypothetical protein